LIIFSPISANLSFDKPSWENASLQEEISSEMNKSVESVSINHSIINKTLIYNSFFVFSHTTHTHTLPANRNANREREDSTLATDREWVGYSQSRKANGVG